MGGDEVVNRQRIQEVSGQGYFIVDFSESYFVQQSVSGPTMMSGWVPAPNADKPILPEQKEIVPEDREQLYIG